MTIVATLVVHGLYQCGANAQFCQLQQALWLCLAKSYGCSWGSVSGYRLHGIHILCLGLSEAGFCMLVFASVQLLGSVVLSGLAFKLV